MLRELLFGDTQRLRHVIRFGTCRRVHDESVAEHSFYTAFYALMLSKWSNAQGRVPFVDMATVLTRALIHDLEEAKSGDFPRPFKHSDSDIHHALTKAGYVALLQTIKGLDAGWMTGVWTKAKDDTPEGAIIEFADFLSVLGYLHGEISGSNIAMREQLDSMKAYYQYFTKSRYDFLRPLVLEAETLMYEVLRSA